MKKNYEIKCSLSDYKTLRKKILDSGRYVYSKENQRDIYYKVRKGRLKLRVINNQTGNLIYYNRNEKSGKRISNYVIFRTSEFKELSQLLKILYSVKIEVLKTREIFVRKNIRIHLDKIKQLGSFLEIEITGNNLNSSELQMSKLISQLGLNENQFIKNSYSDLLIQKK